MCRFYSIIIISNASRILLHPFPARYVIYFINIEN